MRDGPADLGRPPEGGEAELGAMGIGRRFAANRPQAEALRFVEAGALELAVVEDEIFRLSPFEEQLAVFRVSQRVGNQGLDGAPAQAGGFDEGWNGGRRHGGGPFLGTASR